MRLAGERRRERLHIDEVAPVRSYLLVGFVRDVVVSVVVLPLIRVEFFRGPIPCEADKRRPLREVLHGDRRRSNSHWQEAVALYEAESAQSKDARAKPPWKKQVLDNFASLFARGASGSGDGEEERERETAKLYAKIGQLTVERDFLARRPGR